MYSLGCVLNIVKKCIVNKPIRGGCKIIKEVYLTLHNVKKEKEEQEISKTSRGQIIINMNT